MVNLSFQKQIKNCFMWNCLLQFQFALLCAYPRGKWLKESRVLWLTVLISLSVWEVVFTHRLMWYLCVVSYINSRVFESLNLINCRWYDRVNNFWSFPKTSLCRKIWISHSLHTSPEYSFSPSYIYIYIYMERIEKQSNLKSKYMIFFTALYFIKTSIIVLSTCFTILNSWWRFTKTKIF